MKDAHLAQVQVRLSEALGDFESRLKLSGGIVEARLLAKRLWYVLQGPVSKTENAVTSTFGGSQGVNAE